jgi:ABC-2 type transport system ATP-binding protein
VSDAALETSGLTKRYGDADVVSALDLRIERGELYGFLGPNGAGKTTTIRMALGLIDEVLETVGLTVAASKRVRAYSQGMRQRLGIALALLGRPEMLVLDEPTNGLDPAGMREIRELLRSLADDGTTVFVSSHLLGEVEAVCDRVGVLSRGRLVAEGPPSALRGEDRTLRIDVDDPRGALGVVSALPGVRADLVAGGISCTLSDTTAPADVNAALVAAGLRVSALVPQRASLEDVFLSLVEGDGAPR